jgi:hypothetical protein
MTNHFNEGESYMKRFLGILVASMFVSSAVYAAETIDRRVGFVGEQRTPDEEIKSNATSGPVAKSRAETEDRRVGFVGEQRTPDEEIKSNATSGPVAKSRAESEDRRVGFGGEERTPGEN